MPTLFSTDPKALSDSVTTSESGTDAFDSDNDIGTNKPCQISQIQMDLQDAEYCDVLHVDKSGSASILRKSMSKGPLFLGDHGQLEPGEFLRFESVGTPPSGARRITVKAMVLGKGARR